MEMVERDTIFTNVAMTPDGDVWWEGMDRAPAEGMLDWQGRRWTGASGQSRGSSQQPVHRSHAQQSRPVAAAPRIRKACQFPRSSSADGAPRRCRWCWNRLIGRTASILGATMGSETTAAATGKVGVVRRDPMAMLPFCGYNIGDYFAHWLAMQGTPPSRHPRFSWSTGSERIATVPFLWPGYGENMRVLKWIVDRVHGRVGAEQTPVGLVPHKPDLDLAGLDITAARLDGALAVKP